MEHLTPQIIADVTGGKFVGDETMRGIRVVGAVRDNREVKQENLFVCIPGARVDGHSYAIKAFESGAACCLAERIIPDANGPYVLVESTLESIKLIGAHYRSLFSIPVVGITGSVGKTTAKELVAAALGAKLNVLKTKENLNNELGVPLTLLSLSEKHHAAVIEMGISDFGEMGRLAEMVRPDIFIMTKIGYAHLKELGDLNGVLRAKTEAFAYMNPDGIALLNGDDELLRGYDPGIRKITFGLGENNDFRAANIRGEGTSAVSCDIVSKAGSFPVRIPSYGNHLAVLAAAAAAVGSLLGITNDEISRGLQTFVPVDGRANICATESITLIDDCYNANPNSVKAALSSLSELPSRRVAILGDMLNLGAQSDELHHDIGVFAAENLVDCLICCGDRSAEIFSGYRSVSGNPAYHYTNKADLESALPGLINSGDTVLVKASNGMRFEELLPILKGMKNSATLGGA